MSHLKTKYCWKHYNILGLVVGRTHRWYNGSTHYTTLWWTGWGNTPPIKARSLVMGGGLGWGVFSCSWRVTYIGIWWPKPSKNLRARETWINLKSNARETWINFRRFGGNIILRSKRESFQNFQSNLLDSAKTNSNESESVIVVMWTKQSLWQLYRTCPTSKGITRIFPFCLHY